MRLPFAGSGPDGRPADQVSNILRSDRIQKFGGGGDLERNHFSEELTGNCKASWDVIGSIKIRVHDESLPANCSTGLFKIDPHDKVKALLELVGERFESFGIVEACPGVMDRTRSDDNQKALIPSLKDVPDCFPALSNERCLPVVTGNF